MRFLNGFILIGIILFFISIAGLVSGNTLLTEPGQPVNSFAWLEYLGAAALMLVNGAVSIWNARQQDEQKDEKKDAAPTERPDGPKADSTQARIVEITYEGYGPGGVAVLVECATDNRNRTVADIRNIFSKSGGRLGESGSVAWMFNAPQGLITVSNTVTDEDTLISVALEAGAEDVKTVEDTFEVYTSPGDMAKVVEALSAAGIKTLESEITMIPNNTVHIDGKDAQQLLRLIDQLEDHDDVQNVHANFDMPDEVLESAAP